jgi:hypothetical protein
MENRMYLIDEERRILEGKESQAPLGQVMKTVLFYFIFWYKNSLFRSTYIIRAHIISALLNCLSKYDPNEVS